MAEERKHLTTNVPPAVYEAFIKKCEALGLKPAEGGRNAIMIWVGMENLITDKVRGSGGKSSKKKSESAASTPAPGAPVVKDGIVTDVSGTRHEAAPLPEHDGSDGKPPVYRGVGVLPPGKDVDPNPVKSDDEPVMNVKSVTRVKSRIVPPTPKPAADKAPKPDKPAKTAKSKK